MTNNSHKIKFEKNKRAISKIYYAEKSTSKIYNACAFMKNELEYSPHDADSIYFAIDIYEIRLSNHCRGKWQMASIDNDDVDIHIVVFTSFARMIESYRWMIRHRDMHKFIPVYRKKGERFVNTARRVRHAIAREICRLRSK